MAFTTYDDGQLLSKIESVDMGALQIGRDNIELIGSKVLFNLLFKGYLILF